MGCRFFAFMPTTEFISVRDYPDGLLPITGLRTGNPEIFVAIEEFFEESPQA